MNTLPVYAIESQQVGKIEITIKNPDSPMWQGKYQTGRLAIYFAKVVVGFPLIPIIPLIYIISNQDIPELNCMGYQVYGKTDNLLAIQADLMHKINAHYAEYLLQYKNENSPVMH